MSGFLQILEENGFVVKEKSFMGEIDGFPSYNREISYLSEDFVNYLDFPHRREIENLLELYYKKEAIELFIEKLKNEEKMVLKKVSF